MMRKNKPARLDRQTKLDIIYAFILALAFALVIFISGLQYRTPNETISYTVKPGDTLWSIATKYCPGSHTGNVALKIQDINHIDSYIVPGQVLTVPCEPQAIAEEERENG